MATQLPPPVPPIPGAPARTPPVPPQLTPAGAVGGAAVAGFPIEGQLAEPQSFWQSPFVLNVMPFVTSLLMHVGILVLIVVVVKLPDIVDMVIERPQIIIPDADPSLSKQPGGLMHPGLGGDASRDAFQDKFPEIKQSDGIAEKKGDPLRQTLMGGGSGNDTGMDMIAMGPGGGSGKGLGGGKGDRFGSGDGDGSGALAPFGKPGGGGGIGPKSTFIGMGGNASKVLYLCDASGTMTTVFDDLRIELRKSIGNMVVAQSFNVVFFSNDEVIMLNKDGLLPATPANKAKAYEFIDGMAPRGQTNPFPAIKAAFGNNPELIYCLTDGFDAVDSFESVAEAFRSANKDRKVKVTTLLIESSDQPQLRAIMEKIAAENGGKYKRLTADDFHRD